MSRKQIVIAVVLMLGTAVVVSSQQTTTFQTVATSASAPSTTILRNIGQVSHRLVVQMANAPALTCASGATNINLQASFDGSTWWTISANTGIMPAAPVTRIVTAEGAYPYLRSNIAAFDTTNCRVSASYIGSQSVAVGSTGDALDYGVAVINLTTATIGSPVTLAAAVSGLSVVVYEVQVYNLTGPQQVQFTDGAGNILADWEDLPNTSQMVLGKNAVPYWSTAVGESLRVGILNATAVSGFVRYRYE